MSRTLIIAEKPSVAADLAKVLAKAPGMGKFDKVGDHYENEAAIIASAVGHLVELKMPMTAEGKSLPWSFKHLPAIPEEFELAPIEDSKEKLRSIVKLAKQKDVSRIVNACDAGREGELIFRYILRIGKIDKPINRLWMQSMTAGSILDAWKTLRDDEEMRPLADAAVCRSEADWLVGLNATRVLTAFNSRHGGFTLTPAGRVQTPTLMILAEREKLIQAFVPRDYHEVLGTFSVVSGTYPGRWIQPDFKKDPDDDQKREERIWTLAEAEAIRSRCLGKTGTIEEEKKELKQSAKPLYDLTSLQREASGRFGFSARRTLDLAQRLYERYKALTYPRTDSRYLPEDYVGAVKDTLGNLAGDLHDDRAGFAARALEKNWVFKTSRVFDNKKVSDHFAIIPTGQVPKDLDADLAKIYDLVVRRFIAVFYPQAEYDVTTRLTRIAHADGVTDTFKTNGRVLRVPGWLEVYGRAAEVSVGEEADLAPVSPGEKAAVAKLEIKHDVTKPPARYNEGTLLSAMENAGKRVEDEELAEAMKERGLGTPATRAATIEGLIGQKYVARDGRELVVTPKGLDLVNLLSDIGIEALTSPEMTGDWEYKLRQMEHRELPRTRFMSEIKAMTRTIVLKVKQAAEESARRVYPDLKATCPACRGTVINHTDNYYSCANPECSWRMKTYVAQRAITPAEVITLLEKGSVGPFSGFKNRFHKEFEAALEIDDKGKVQFRFADQGDSEESDPANLGEPIARISLPGGGDAPVYETEKAYLCPDLKSPAEPKGVRISKQILQRAIPRDQAIKLFTEHKTDLLQGFVSKSKRRFAAHLVFDPKTGKIGFEFAERKGPPRKAAAKKSKEK
ncbi:MAG: DNA topoisomerase III [Verrucomicrobiales bacterium]